MTPPLEDAIALAARAHRGQKDRAGEPYVLHVLRVMLRQQDETARIAGVLHDVVEDTPTTLADLRAAGYGEEICDAVDCLTRRSGEPYERMIARVAGNAVARRVKLADLEDNMDPRRQENHGAEVLARLAKYQAAWNKLKALEQAE
jgi:(p)ppGpp synthase/HD superfamily hydrolase